MKRILLMCSFCTVFCTISRGQTTTTKFTPQKPTTMPAATVIAPVPEVSKNEFADKAGKLDALIAQNRMDVATVSLEEIERMMQMEVDIVSAKINDAVKANDNAGKAYLSELLSGQQAIYADLNNLKTDMHSNRKQIHDDLMKYATIIF